MKTKTLLIILLVVGAIIFIGKHMVNTMHHPLSIIPIEAGSKKRLFDATKHPNQINGYPETVWNLLLSSTEEELVVLSCSETFIRNWESLFFMRNHKNLKYTISLPNDAMLDLITPLEASLPDAYENDKKFLLGRLCKTEDSRQFLEFHRGVQAQFYDNYVALGDRINFYLFIGGKNTLFPNPIDVSRQENGRFFHCFPMQLTKTNLLYYQCSEIQQGVGTTWFYEIDLTALQSKTLGTCTYRYEGKPKRECR